LSSTTTNIKLRILVVDDEPDILLTLNALLREQGHSVKIFDNSSDAMRHLTSSELTPYDLVITDYKMPGGISGLDLAIWVKEHTRRKTKVFLMTGFDVSSMSEFSEALKSGMIDEIIQKPIPNDRLVAVIEKSFLHHNH
jgi:DNA-binding NtrC family response regulator